MKKYLMTGIAAVALCAAFTSCSHDMTPASQEEINAVQAKKVVDTYNAAFVAKFGQPASNQDWGFGSGASARTRANAGANYATTHEYKDANGNVVAGANMNHNEWADPTKEKGGWEVVPALTPEQKAVVTAYFQCHPNLGYEDPQLRHFFVQQVYKGGSAQAGASSESITAANGSVYNSGNMNLLTVGEANSHINNFNAGTCSESDVLDNGQSVGGTTHKDQITLMVNVDDTSCFGYHETGSSTHHNNKAGLVGWAIIHEWAQTNYPGYVAGFAGWLDDGYNRSYMGFDLALKEGAEASSDVAMKYNDGPESYNYAMVNGSIVSINGDTEIEVNGKKIYYLSTNKNQYVAAASKTIQDSEIQAEYRVNGQLMGKYVNVDNLLALINDGWLPVKDKNLREWVKVGKSDGYFTDWIVTLTEAKRKDVEDPNNVRIIAEDLTPSTTDWDFNDVVFDVEFNEAGTSAQVTLLKAGGTLELKVAGHEVHAAFGYPDPDPTTGRYKMINTGAKADVNGATAQPFTVSCNKNNRGNDIVIEVNKGTKENPIWITLEAKQGQPAAKLAVKTTFQIPDERVNIETYYPNFLKYVKDPSVIWW